MFGARTASENVPRKAKESTGAQIRLAFQVVVWPIVAQADPRGPLGRHEGLPAYQETARQVARRHDAELVDLVPLVEGRAGLFIDDVHMSPRGYRRVANAVAEAIPAE